MLQLLAPGSDMSLRAALTSPTRLRWSRSFGARRLPTACAAAGTAIAGVASGVLVAMYPVVAAAALAGSGVLLASLVSVELVMGFLLATRNVTDVFAGQEFLLVGSALTLNPSAILGLIILPVAAVAALRRGVPSGTTRLALIALPLTAWTILGLIHYGFHPSVLAEYLRLLSILGVLVLATTVPRPLVSRGVALVIGAAAPAAVLLLYQFVTGDAYALLPVSPSDATPALSPLARERPAGPFAHANAAATMFALTSCLCVWKLAESRRSYRYMAAFALFVLAVFATQSIGGIAQLLTTLLAYVFLTSPSESVRSRVALRRFAAATATLLLLITFLLTPLGQERFSELRTTQTFSVASTGSTTNSADWRFFAWSAYLNSWRDQPILGHGLGATTELVTPLNNLPHSELIRWLLEAGVVGLLLLSLGYFLLVRGLRRRSVDRSEEQIPLAAVALAAVIGLTVHGMVSDVTLNTAAMYSVAAVVGLALSRRGA